MTEISEGDTGGPTEPLDEVRDAASAVISSLKRLLEATEKVIADPVAFDQAVAGGKGLLDAFTHGFVNESRRTGAAAADPAEQVD